MFYLNVYNFILSLLVLICFTFLYLSNHLIPFLPPPKIDFYSAVLINENALLVSLSIPFHSISCYTLCVCVCVCVPVCLVCLSSFINSNHREKRNRLVNPIPISTHYTVPEFSIFEIFIQNFIFLILLYICACLPVCVCVPLLGTWEPNR